MELRWQQSRTILSKVSGFLSEAGFTHSLTPARNCTFGCTYCYVPTMRIQGGLKPEDWRRWGQFTTFKQNAADLLRRELRPDQIIYCSPLTDPYQPAEAEAHIMPAIWRAVIDAPPKVFALQTRGPLLLRDLDLIKSARARVSFSLTTDDDDIRRRFEPHCAPIPERLATIRALRDHGIEVFATLAPILPCNPERLIEMAVSVTDTPLIGDPFHLRATKQHGATTRDAAFKILDHLAAPEYATPAFQSELIDRLQTAAAKHNRTFQIGPPAFALLSH